jgi:hypothetical protein
MGYLDDVARWRMQRHQQKIVDRVEQIADEYRQASHERDVALANGDAEEAAFHDDDAMQLEQEYLQYCPPQRPQMHPSDAEFLWRKQAFRERHGAHADAAIQQAHAYATRPRLANSNIANLNQHGMGLRPQTPAYYRAMNNLLEMYGKDGGLHFDPNENALTANEAAKISGVSPNTYNAASQQLAAQGRFTRNR